MLNVRSFTDAKKFKKYTQMYPNVPSIIENDRLAYTTRDKLTRKASRPTEKDGIKVSSQNAVVIVKCKIEIYFRFSYYWNNISSDIRRRNLIRRQAQKIFFCK